MRRASLATSTDRRSPGSRTRRATSCPSSRPDRRRSATFEGARTDKYDLARHRLRSQRLAGNPLESADALVGWLGAMQGQEYGYAKWSIGQRTTGLTDAAVDGMLADGRILRTHILRPTWHFVLPADIRWIMSVTAPRVHLSNRHWLRQAELDPPTLRRANDILANALAGRRLTRRQVQAELATGGIEASGPRLAYILMEAELELRICSGGLEGKQQTYALLDERAPGTNPYSADEALAELTRRYFTSRGPSSIADFTWWSSLTVADVKRGLAIVGSDLQRMTFEGTDYWFADLPPGAGRQLDPSPTAHLIYGLDELIVGYQKTRSALDVAGLATGIATGLTENNFFHAILIDSQVAGLWRRVVTNGGVVIETRLLRRLNASEESAVEAAVERYGQFLGVPTTLA